MFEESSRYLPFTEEELGSREVEVGSADKQQIGVSEPDPTPNPTTSANLVNN